MGAPEAAPDLAYKKSDGAVLSRIEMEQQIKERWRIVHWVRLKASQLYNLPKQAAFGMREAVLRHWVLDEMIRRGQIVGNQIGVSTTNFEDEAEQRQFIQRLIAMVQTGQALTPAEGEGVDMNGFQNPPPPAPPGSGGPGNGSSGQPSQGFTPPPPPPMGGQQMAPPPPPNYGAPPQQQPLPGYAPPQPQPPQQFQPPPMGSPPGYPPQGYAAPPAPPAPPPGYAQQAPQPGYAPPQMTANYPPTAPGAIPPGPPAPPVAGGPAPAGRGRRKSAPDTQQSANVPPPQAAAPVPPMGYPPIGATSGVPLPPQGFAPLGAQQPNMQHTQSAPDPGNQISQIQAQISALQRDLKMTLQGIAVLVDAFYQKPGNADIVASLTRVGVKVPQ